MNSSPTRRLTRRAFHKAAASSVAALAVPGFLRARGANDKLNIAMIGSGGRGRREHERRRHREHRRPVRRRCQGRR